MSANKQKRGYHGRKLKEQNNCSNTRETNIEIQLKWFRYFLKDKRMMNTCR